MGSTPRRTLDAPGVGLDGPAAVWRSVHHTPLANALWFHGSVDALETGRNNLEAGVAPLPLFVAVGGYYAFADREVL